MNEQPESLVSQIRSKLDDDKEVTPTESTFDPEVQVMERYEGWLATLKRQFPSMSKKALERRAAELACLNRKERRRAFKHSSMKLPRFMTIPKGKR
jgi:hypothetical protein